MEAFGHVDLLFRSSDCETGSNFLTDLNTKIENSKKVLTTYYVRVRVGVKIRVGL
jgi:hypothetical protein